MEYPRIPKHLWKKKVLTPEQDAEIKAWYFSNGQNIRLTAKTFGVSRSSVIRITNPRRYKELTARARAKVLARYHSDPNFRQKTIEQNSKTALARQRAFPAIKEFNKQGINLRRKENPTPFREKNKKTYQRHKHKYLATALEKYYRDMPQPKKLEAYVRHSKAVESLLKAEPLLVLVSWDGKGSSNKST